MHAPQTTDAIHQRYLQAAELAEAGDLAGAEAGLRSVVADAPELVTARFQLGQLLWVRGDASGAVDVLAPLMGGDSALAAYARAIAAAAGDDAGGMVAALQEGLALPQDNPALAGDMQRLLARVLAEEAPAAASPAVRSLSAYGQDD